MANDFTMLKPRHLSTQWQTFSHTLGDVETVAPVGTSHHTLAKVEAKTHLTADTWRYTGQRALVIATCRH